MPDANNMAASERVFDLLDTPPAITNSATAKPLPEIVGEVTFEDVVFGYEPGKPILKGVSLTAAPGDTVALVGETGAGKSTIVNLIGRFYDVDEGQVRIDGYPVDAITLRSLRTQMGTVPQDAFLFADTIANNIRYYFELVK